jgi:hypothetical protein
MDIKVSDPELGADGRHVHVEIIVDGHPFQAVFVRRPNGTVSAPAMHVAGLAEHPRAKKLEEAFGEAARHFRRDHEALLDSMLPSKDTD